MVGKTLSLKPIQYILHIAETEFRIILFHNTCKFNFPSFLGSQYY